MNRPPTSMATSTPTPTRVRTRLARTLAVLSAAAIALGAVACGEIEGAALNAANAPFVAVGATDVLIQSHANTDLSFLPGVSTIPLPAMGSPAGALAPLVCESGSFEESDDESRVEFDACYVDGCLVDGAAIVVLSDDFTELSIDFEDFFGVCDDGREAYLGNSSVVCTGLLDFAPVCDYDFDTLSFAFTGANTGTRLSVDDLEVALTPNQLFTLDGVMNYPGYGRVWFDTARVIEFNDCDGGVPEQGRIEMTGSLAGVSATTRFVSCDEFEVCYFDNAAVPVCTTELWLDWFPED